MTDRAAGNALFSTGQYAEAIAIYEKLSSDAAALSNASEACIQLEKFENAEIFARQSLEVSY
jgi:tetratricopeptide (TPR) repeat protein